MRSSDIDEPRNYCFKSIERAPKDIIQTLLKDIFMVRRSGDWMVIWDDRIMEVMLEEETVTATKLAERDEIRVSRQHISTRLSKMEQHELVKDLGNSVYMLTDEGVGYLNEAYDAGDSNWFDQDGKERMDFMPHEMSPRVTRQWAAILWDEINEEQLEDEIDYTKSEKFNQYVKDS